MLSHWMKRMSLNLISSSIQFNSNNSVKTTNFETMKHLNENFSLKMVVKMEWFVWYKYIVNHRKYINQFSPFIASYVMDDRKLYGEYKRMIRIDTLKEFSVNIPTFFTHEHFLSHIHIIHETQTQ